MSIPIIEGLAAGREALLRQRSLAQVDPSPEGAASLRRLFGRQVTPQEAVDTIIADVRQHGDIALRQWTLRLDGTALEDLAVSEGEIEAAYQETPMALREALFAAAGRIRAFHEKEPKGSWLAWEEDSALGQIVRPLERVGVYVPGGAAAYPSTLLMTAIPAQVAGVREILVTTPPDREGQVARSVLAAARILGLRRLYRIGGAQAIAALAYGTESIAQVDKIVGPGNLFVTLAKRSVYGQVGIDGLFGPTETFIIADEAANPTIVAADLLAQAEHDVLASVVLATSSRQLAYAVRAEVERRLGALERRAIIAVALGKRGAIVIVADLEEALGLANDYAPEHLCLLTAQPWSLVDRVRNAGGLFLGEPAGEALGDYILGPSHSMPTGATARFASPLRVADFLKVTSLFSLGAAGAARLAPYAVTLAQAEGLTAHGAAAAARQGRVV